MIQLPLSDVEPPNKYFIYVRDNVAEECSQNLGFDIDVYITSTTQVLTRVWYGETDIHRVIDRGLVKVVAQPVYLQSLSRWFGISSFKDANAQPFQA